LGSWSQTTRANRKATIVRESLKEAESETCGATNRNRIQGGVDQGERANDREALATKETLRRSGARAGTASGLTWGDLASPLKGGRGVSR
jgi:hypothetical protein